MQEETSYVTVFRDTEARGAIGVRRECVSVEQTVSEEVGALGEARRRRIWLSEQVPHRAEGGITRIGSLQGGRESRISLDL